MLHIRWDGFAVPGADRHGLFTWHMQQQSSCLRLTLAPNSELDLVLLRLAKLVRPCTDDLDLQSYCSLMQVQCCFSDICLISPTRP